MDGELSREDLKHLEHKLETTIESILESLKDFEERLEAIEDSK